MTETSPPQPNPTVTVVMPAYNAETTVGAAISGVLAQTLPGVQLVVVDDGSTDATGAICRAFGDLITYIRTDNHGSSAARNTGLQAATGEFIALCDADDVLLPPYLETSLRLLGEHGERRSLVMNEAYLLTDQGLAHGRRLIHNKFPRPGRQRLAMLQKNFVSIFTVFPRELVEEIGGFDVSLRYCEDWDFWMRAVLQGWEVLLQPVPHAMYRWSAGAKSVELDAYLAEDDIIRRALQAHGSLLTDEERTFILRRLRSSAPRLLDIQGGEALRRGDWQGARAAYRELARLSSEDRQTSVKAMAVGYLPGVARLERVRQRRIDAAVGRRELKPSTTTVEVP